MLPYRNRRNHPATKNGNKSDTDCCRKHIRRRSPTWCGWLREIQDSLPEVSNEAHRNKEVSNKEVSRHPCGDQRRRRDNRAIPRQTAKPRRHRVHQAVRIQAGPRPLQAGPPDLRWAGGQRLPVAAAPLRSRGRQAWRKPAAIEEPHKMALRKSHREKRVGRPELPRRSPPVKKVAPPESKPNRRNRGIGTRITWQ
jgi:hypothetical protein